MGHAASDLLECGGHSQVAYGLQSRATHEPLLGLGEEYGVMRLSIQATCISIKWNDLRQLSIQEIFRFATYPWIQDLWILQGAVHERRGGRLSKTWSQRPKARRRGHVAIYTRIKVIGATVSHSCKQDTDGRGGFQLDYGLIMLGGPKTVLKYGPTVDNTGGSS